MRRSLTLLASWGAICLVTLGVGWLLVHPLAGSVGVADDGVARWFVTLRTPTLDHLAEAGRLAGETPTGDVVIGLSGVAFAAWCRSWRPLVFAALSFVGIGGIYFAATHLDERSRPPVRILDSGLVPNHSFPSGHVGTATAIAAVLAVLLWTCTRIDRRWLLLLGLLPLLTLVSRLYQGAHHLTDVLVALLYTLGWTAVVARVVLPPLRDAATGRHPDVSSARQSS